MASTRKRLVLGTYWSLLFFIFFFVKAIVVIPFMLRYWGADAYTFWVLLMSLRIIIHFLSDGFIRYALNHYNLLYHNDTRKAAYDLNANINFLIVYNIVLLIFLAPISFNDNIIAALFNTNAGTADIYNLGIALYIHNFATAVQSVIRLCAGANEPVGKYWKNAVFEIIILIAEIIFIIGLLVNGANFSQIVYANSVIMAAGALIYFLVLRKEYFFKLFVFKKIVFIKGAKTFYKSTPFNVNNFFEKIANESLPALLAIFKFPAAIIPVYTSLKTLANAPVMANNMLLGAFTPEIQKSYTERNGDKILKLFSIVWVIFGAVITTAVIGFYPYYDDIYDFWLNGKLVFDPTFLSLLLIDSFIILFGSCYVFFLKGTNAMKPLLYGTIAKGAILLILIFTLGKTADSIGIALICAEIVCNIVIYQILVSKILKKLGYPNPLPVFLTGMAPYILAAITLLSFIIYRYTTSIFILFLILNAAILLYSVKKQGILEHLKQIKRKSN